MILVLDPQKTNHWRPSKGQLSTLQTSLAELADLAEELLHDPPAVQPTHCLSLMDSLLHLMTDVETQLAHVRETLEEERLRHNDWLLTETDPHD